MTQQATELEESILGSILDTPNELMAVIDILRPEHFYDRKNEYIWNTMLKLNDEQQPIEPMSVIAELKKQGYLEVCGGAYGVSKLTDKIHLSQTTEYKARIVVEKYLLRKIHEFGTNIANQSLLPQADCFDLSEKFSSLLDQINEKFQGNKIQSMGDLRDQIVTEMKTAIETGKNSGVPIRLKRLQDWTNGWRPGNLIVIAARPGMGKTASGIHFAEYPASIGMPVGFFSLEMPAKELTSRIMSIYSRISAQKINNSIVTPDEIQHIEVETSELHKLPLYIDDTPYLTIRQLRVKAMRWKREKNIQLIIVDYLQLMEGTGNEGNREQELSKVSRGLKGLAKELEIPIIALAQLNRESTKRADQKPRAADIRECGAIEQDADMIIFPHRPEYLSIDSYMFDGQEIPSQDLIVYIIEKYRGGGTGDIPATWNGRLMEILDYGQE
jgi:replicative DNA helicase